MIDMDKLFSICLQNCFGMYCTEVIVNPSESNQETIRICPFSELHFSERKRAVELHLQTDL